METAARRRVAAAAAARVEEREEKYTQILQDMIATILKLAAEKETMADKGPITIVEVGYLVTEAPATLTNSLVMEEDIISGTVQPARRGFGPFDTNRDI